MQVFWSNLLVGNKTLNTVHEKAPTALYYDIGNVYISEYVGKIYIRLIPNFPQIPEILQIDRIPNFEVELLRASTSTVCDIPLVLLLLISLSDESDNYSFK